jgi:hypothetical protein
LKNKRNNLKRSEVEDADMPPDFFAPFIFGCVVLAGLTGIILGLCLRIEAIRRFELFNKITSALQHVSKTRDSINRLFFSDFWKIIEFNPSG